MRVSPIWICQSKGEDLPLERALASSSNNHQGRTQLINLPSVSTSLN